ncbi:FtsP/CotA-like multicopper oxidase with cupredoxin domain [Crossiella equi]|uniref:FtsP/CotA-like multicopper oxidase with cupredoxin domain n=1 Tax=Crossiella equi TaxID=130796 RepID=A0ABS5AFU6_9PSEU|nr:multicopper oxidase family protein [Crossiella equi]MBP2475463.1 FtsP/CotA-like multicopper oxidase with cupredoxin domain [Crossiella equi]
MYALGYLLEFLSTAVLLLPLLLFARTVRRTGRAGVRRCHYVLAVLVLKLPPAAVLLSHGLAFGIRPLRTFVLVGVPMYFALRYTLPVLRRGGTSTDPKVVLPARLAAVGGGLAAVLNLLVQDTLTLWLAVAVFALVALVVVLDTSARHRAHLGLPATVRWSPWARLAAPLVLVVAAAGCGVAGSTLSAFPERLSMNSHGHHGTTEGRDLTELTGGPYDGPVRAVTITATEVDGRWTFGGTVPGTALRVRQGEVLSVRLLNRLPVPTTIHWHGVDVPNAVDGVAGVTQDAVPPGGEFTYTFRAAKPGTYWYHSHQVAHEQVRRGLFGTLVVDPAAGPAAEVDETLVVHQLLREPRRLRAEPGRRVRLRVVNANSGTERFTVTGGPFRIAALDGQELNEPGELTDRAFSLGGGGRADLDFLMPDNVVQVSNTGKPILTVTSRGQSVPAVRAQAQDVDLTAYGRPAPTPFGPDSAFTTSFAVDLDQGFGFHAGAFSFLWTVDGRVFPDAPMLRVREGDLVRVVFRNKGVNDHPMHLHGHHVLVLSRDGNPVTGSPLWLDTVLVRPGETWEVGFRADNPGIWMDHCHDLLHATNGMTLHVGYEGVRTPFTVGPVSGNKPE